MNHRGRLIALCVALLSLNVYAETDTGTGAPFSDGRFSNPHMTDPKEGIGAYLRMRLSLIHI